MPYTLDSPRHGRFHLVAHTSGVHGFGAPKKFKISARSDGFGPVYVLAHRDRHEYGVTERPRANIELIRIAVEQFCRDCPLVADVHKDLDPDCPMFAGRIANPQGKPLPGNAVAGQRPTEGGNSGALSLATKETGKSPIA